MRSSLLYHSYPRRPPRTSKTLLVKPGQCANSDDDIPTWPSDRPRELQRKLIKQSFSDFTYLSKMYCDENRRMEEFKRGTAGFVPDMNSVLKTSKDSRKAAVYCGLYLDKHADLFHKMDPGFRHTKSDV
ncbi:unnamed protein product [Dicrocoelium dendriticum]|nr:unnamed protein product [Dicrocoelium dendriticum]